MGNAFSSNKPREGRADPERGLFLSSSGAGDNY
jgi:hypothetical protein